jgi:hypothetical protein
MMGTIVELPRPDFKFPHFCVVCSAPSSKEYLLRELFIQGYPGKGGGGIGLSAYVNMMVPMCTLHYQEAIEESPAEHFLRQHSRKIAILLGVFGAMVILGSVQIFSGSAFFSLFVALLAGLAAFAFFDQLFRLLAAYLAYPETKQIRRAVRLTAYSSKTWILRMEFENDNAAAMVLKESRK